MRVHGSADKCRQGDISNKISFEIKTFKDGSERTMENKALNSGEILILIIDIQPCICWMTDPQDLTRAPKKCDKNLPCIVNYDPILIPMWEKPSLLDVVRMLSVILVNAIMQGH